MATNNSTLYLMSYNNYYNRIVKREATLDDYPISADYVPLVCNFNPADGIDTEHVMNVPYIANTPEADYLVVVGEDGEINSRWFIVNATRTRGGQYRLSLHRDLIADFYDAVVSSPTYIERAMLPLSSPFIYNSENMLFNQIKTAEYPLMDATNSPWVVIYMDRTQTESKVITAQTNIVENTTLTADVDAIRAAGIGETLYGDFFEDPVFEFRADMTIYEYFTYSSLGDVKETNVKSTPPRAKFRQITDSSSAIDQIKNGFVEGAKAWNNLAKEYFYYKLTDNSSIVSTLKRISGKTIRDIETGNLYLIKAKFNVETKTIGVDNGTNLERTMSSTIGNLPNIEQRTEYDETYFKTTYFVETAVIESIEIVAGQEVSGTIREASNRAHLTDNPWDMLAIPQNTVRFRISDTMTLSSYGNLAVSIAQKIATELGSHVYDIQLLPYCPCPEYMTTSGAINLRELANGVNYINFYGEEDGQNEDFTYGIWCNQSSFRVNITNSNPITVPQNAVEFKVANECDMYRIVSPNYAGAFEFSATKNGGIIGFEVNCTYKPIQPYIHINPMFSGLYGRDFNDNRGLICGGNFSMPYAQDKWIEYQIQNSAFEDSFERQITNMETTYEIQRKQQKVAGGLGAATAGISGATTGAMVGSLGGPVGMAVGGVVGAAAGAITSAAGLSADLKYAEELQKEALSYTRDQFDLSLQNIKALPNTLSNVGAFDINYKYFPFLEYYTCTDVEKEALRQKIKYNGMAVNAIGTLSDYQGGFVQGQLIRLEGVVEDFHCAAAIANEIHKGVYI